MSTIDKFLAYLAAVPPEVAVSITALFVTGYALYILHDLIRRHFEHD